MLSHIFHCIMQMTLMKNNLDCVKKMTSALYGTAMMIERLLELRSINNIQFLSR